MEMDAGGSCSRKRKSAGLDPDEAAAPAAEGHGPEPADEDQEPPLPAAGGGGEDRISHLPDGVLGDTISLLPTKEGARTSRKRKSAGLDPDEAAAQAPAAEEHGTEPADEDQEPPLPAAGGGGEDLISHLPDDVLGDIITLLPTKEGALTSLLASRWRHLWCYAPLNLDHRGLRKDVKDLAALVSRILSAHKGPVRRFCVPLLYDDLRQVATVEAWIRSPAFRNLQELDMCRFGFQYAHLWPKPVPATAAFCFSGTLCAATIADCHVPDITAQAIHFPKLKKLELDHVTISESSLRTVLTGCLALDCLLIAHSYGFRRVQINSISLRRMCVKGYCAGGPLHFGELIIQNAPCLERLIQHGSYNPHISVISAPRLETLGFISSDARLALGLTVIQELRIVDNLMPEVRTVKILAVNTHALSLDVVIGLLRCFPCLEKLYIKSRGRGESNVWRKKHLGFTTSFDIRLKKISWEYYRGIKSHVDFATFFVENAKVLELMTIQVSEYDYHEAFFAEHHKKLRLDSKASRGARFRFTTDEPHRRVKGFRAHDLDLADPFERKDPHPFRDLS